MSNPTVSGAITSAEFTFWQDRASDNKTFNRISWLFLIITLVFAGVVKITQLPEVTRAEKEKVPPQLTKIIERITIEPKPEVEKPKPVVEEKVEKKPVEIKAKVIDKVENVEIEKARERAKNSGLLAMADDLAAMRDMVDLPSVSQPLATQQDVVSEPKPDKVEVFKSEAVAANGQVNTQSGTSDVALVNRDVVVLADKDVVGGTLGGTATQLSDDSSGDTVGDAQSAKRKIDAIRLVLDRNKGAFYTIYRRALRKDPSLEGKVTMMIVVEPNGSVSSVEIVSSELDDAKLERKLIARVKLINFGKDVSEQTSISYSFNFLPY